VALNDHGGGSMSARNLLSGLLAYGDVATERRVRREVWSAWRMEDAVTPDARESQGLSHSFARSAWRVSVQSVVWTVVAGSSAVAVGLRQRSVVLVAFGAIGVVDAVGSAALAHHFRHSVRHDEFSEQLERRAHRIVLVGLFVVGCGAIVGSVARLVSGSAAQPSGAGVVLGATSLIVLTGLSARKRRLAALVSSGALRSDGHLSAVGAAQAGVTLAGTATSAWFTWDWADATAALVVGCGAVAAGFRTWLTETRAHGSVPRQPFIPVALALASVITVG
jgi:divalent metal cation (Fe/Co/Zn/Cd) transporter